MALARPAPFDPMANRTPLLVVVAALAATLLYVSWPADGGDAEVPVAPAAAQPAAPEAGDAAAATLPAGTERVEVSAPQQAAAGAAAEGPRGEGRLTGIVQDEAGVPAAEVEVSWGPATSVFFGFGGGAQQQDRKARTDASGRFELGGVAAGELLVRTASPRFLPTQTQVTLAEKQQKTDLVLVVKEGKGIAGFVVDDRGAVVPGARVVAQRREERGSTIVLRFVAGEATTTDERGWFLLRNLEGDKATIRASQDGFTSAFAEDVPVGSTGAELRMMRLGTVRGRLVDLGGAPIVGSTIRAESQVAGEDPKRAMFDSSRRTFRNVETDAEGAFEVRDVPPGTVRVLANGKDHVPAELGGLVLAAGGVLENVLVTASRGAIARVRVLDPKGEPLADAEVVASLPAPVQQPEQVVQIGGGMVRGSAVVSTRTVRSRNASGEVEMEEYYGEERRVATAKTDAQGIAVLQGLPGGTLQFRATHPRHPGPQPLQQGIPASGTVEIELKMLPSGTLEVTVVEADGRPAPETAVVLDGPLGGAETPNDMEATDDKGKATFRKLLPGDYEVRLQGRQPVIRVAGGPELAVRSADELSETSKRIVVVAEQQAVIELRKPQMVRLYGTVRGAERLVAGVEVELGARRAQPQDGIQLDGNGTMQMSFAGLGFPGSGGPSGRSDAAGTFEIKDVTPGAYTVFFGKSGQLVKAEAEVVIPEGVKEHRIDLVLQLGRIVLQAVRAADPSQPVAGARVEVRKPEAGGNGASVVRSNVMVMGISFGDGEEGTTFTTSLGGDTKKTDAEGRAVIEDVPPGTYEVVLTHGDFTVTSVTAVVTEGATRDLGAVRMDPALQISGTVVAADGSTPGLVLVECNDMQPQPSSNGRFLFRSLAPGNYTLRARAIGEGGRGTAGPEVKVELAPGVEPAPVQLRLPPR